MNDPASQYRLTTRTSDAVFAWRQRRISGRNAAAVVACEFLRALLEPPSDPSRSR